MSLKRAHPRCPRCGAPSKDLRKHVQGHAHRDAKLAEHRARIQRGT